MYANDMYTSSWKGNPNHFTNPEGVIFIDIPFFHPTGVKRCSAEDSGARTYIDARAIHIENRKEIIRKS